MTGVIVVYLALVAMVAVLSTFDPEGLPWSRRWQVLLLGPVALLFPALLVLGSLYIISKLMSR